jgi:hypothetical protein
VLLTEWISVKDELPEMGIEVIDGMPTCVAPVVFAIDTSGYPAIAYYDGELDEWFSLESFLVDVAYWMMHPTLEELNERNRHLN